MSDNHSLDLSEEDDELDNHGPEAPEFSGTLCKWTNYIHGWQDRYIVIKDGTLSYYKSELDTGFGCRGSVSILKAAIKGHEFDECRFDVSVSDCVWYLRAQTPEEKQRWLDVLETHKSVYEESEGLRRHGSSVSLTSNNISTASGSSFRRGRGLREKICEMETYRDILVRQVDTLQSYFDACVQATAAIKPIPNGSVEDLDEDSDDIETDNSEKHPRVALEKVSRDLLLQHGAHALDFRGEALTFKATTSGLLTTLQHYLDLMGQREEAWKKRLEREVEKRKKLEELHHRALEVAQNSSQKVIVRVGPDYEEGPHSTIGEEEFYDAVETGLDKLEEEQEFYERLRAKQVTKFNSKVSAHPLWKEIERVTQQQLEYALKGVEDGVWQLFAEDGEMRMYKREEEVNGLAVDPLKAVHTVKGVTGRELCQYFYDPSVRFEWETTVENMKVLETVSDDTVVMLQIHKRVWPASQRDALFWSHICRVPNEQDRDGHDIWIVCNNSTAHPEAPVGANKCVRVGLTVCLVGQTFLDPPPEGEPVTRDQLTCKITYCAVVNPGGWAPTSALRAVYKREYPKFLKRFTQYVIDKCKDQPIQF